MPSHPNLVNTPTNAAGAIGLLKSHSSPLLAVTFALISWRCFGGVRLEDQSLSLLRGQAGYILLGTVFLFVGLNACAIAIIRRRGELRILASFGLFIGMYGARLLVEAASVLGIVPNLGWPALLIAIVDYLLVVPAFLFWGEMSLGNLRRFSRAGAIVGVGINTIGLGAFFTTGSSDRFLPYNQLLAISMLLVLGIVALRLENRPPRLPFLSARGGDRKEAIFQAAAMIGGVVLARAVQDPRLSDEILKSVRQELG